MKRLLILLSVALFLAACATDNTEPPAPLVALTPQVQVDEIWSASAGSGSDGELLGLAPAVNGNRVFAASSGGRVSAWSVNNGRRIWITDTDVHIGGGPGVGNNVVAVGSTNGVIVALSANNGHRLWTVNVNSSVLTSPAVADGVVVVRTGDGRLIGLSAEDGHQLWRLSRDVPRLSLRGAAAPVIRRDTVFAGFDDGSLLAVKLHAGRVVWEQTVAVAGGGNDLQRMTDLDGEPVIQYGFVYAVTYQGKLAALTSGSGESLWKIDLSSYNGVSYGDRQLYVSDQKSIVHAINAASGSTVWDNSKMKARALTRPTPFHGTVAMGDLDGYVHFLSQQTGKIVARVRADSAAITAAPVVANDTLLVLSDDGELTAYRFVGAD